MLLLFRHSAKSSIAQEEHLATSPIRSHLPHEIVVRLNVLKGGNGGLIWCLSSSLSLSVGFSIRDEAMDVARSAPQGAQYYHADVIYSLP